MGDSHLRLAWQELTSHPVRSLSAGIGIAIAVGALLAGTSLQASAQRRLAATVAARGDHLLVLTAGAEQQGAVRASLLPAAFVDGNLVALRREVGGIEQLAPAASRRAIVAAGNKSTRALLLGTTPDFFSLTAQPLATGRWMSKEELDAGAPVCIVGERLRARLFESAAALGSAVRAGTLVCQVIGVLSPAPAAANPGAEDVLVMPLVTLQRDILGAQSISAIYMSTREDHFPLVVRHQVDVLMREQRHLEPGAVADFSLADGRGLMPAPPGASGPLPATLDAVAAVSFLLGGLCLMTTLFSSIQARRRQIGAWIAQGAHERDLTLRLWVEATLHATLAGLCGIPIGLVLTYAGSRCAGFDFSVSALGLALSLLAAALVGAVFGLIPACRGAKLEVTEVLHQD